MGSGGGGGGGDVEEDSYYDERKTEQSLFLTGTKLAEQYRHLNSNGKRSRVTTV